MKSISLSFQSACYSGFLDSSSALVLKKPGIWAAVIQMSLLIAQFQIFCTSKSHFNNLQPTILSILNNAVVLFVRTLIFFCLT